MADHIKEELEAMLAQAQEDLRIEKIKNRFNRIFNHRKAQTYLTRPNSVPYDEEVFHRKILYKFDNATVKIEYLYDEVWGSGKLQFFRYDCDLEKIDVEDEIELEEDECRLFEEMFKDHQLILDNEIHIGPNFFK